MLLYTYAICARDFSDINVVNNVLRRTRCTSENELITQPDFIVLNAILYLVVCILFDISWYGIKLCENIKNYDCSDVDRLFLCSMICIDYRPRCCDARKQFLILYTKSAKIIIEFSF